MSGDNADLLRNMELLLRSQTDRDMSSLTATIDVWYGLRIAVRKFAEWTKSRMDVLTEQLDDAEFNSMAAALQLPEEAKVNFLHSMGSIFFHMCRLFLF